MNPVTCVACAHMYVLAVVHLRGKSLQVERGSDCLRSALQMSVLPDEDAAREAKNMGSIHSSSHSALPSS